MQRINIPATSANLGPGFDSLGLALALYNSIDFEPMDSGFEIKVENSDRFIPVDERNLIYRVFKRAAKLAGRSVPGIRMVQRNAIPMTRGLGSSAACTVGGIVAANTLMGEPLSLDDMLNLAVEIEGHPDNILPAMLGGMTIAVSGPKLTYIKIDPPKRLKCAIFVPDFTFPTRKARAALPQQVPLQDAVYNLSRAALLAAAVGQDKLELLGEAMQDKLHQPHRKTLIPGFDDIIRLSLDSGALGACLSGSGSTMIALLGGDYDAFLSKAQSGLAAISGEWKVSVVDIDSDGYKLLPAQ